MTKGLRVLIVDDNPNDRRLAARALAAEFGGIELSEAIDAESLTKALERGAFDAVVTDYRLRWTTGLDVLSVVKERYPSVPVVMFTGTGTEDVAVAAMKSGLDDYVVKTPRHFARLPMAVKSALERQRGRKAEADLIAAEDRFRALIENAIDMVAVIGADAKYIYASPSVQLTLGWPADELVGRSFAEFAAAEDIEPLQEIFRALVKTPGEVKSFVCRVQHRDGSWRQIEGTARSLLEIPSVKGIILNAHDITDRTQLEEQLRITERMESVGRLAGGVAHDLNNLLTVIAGSAAFLLDDLPEDSPRREDAMQIQFASERATSLISQLLAFGRRRPGAPTALDLNEIIAGFEPMLRNLLGEGVKLVIDLAPSLGEVEADRVQLEQVIVNLIVNARDATKHKGTVTLKTGQVVLTEHKPMLGIGPGRFAWLSVADDGTGMSSEVRERVFEPFFTTKEGEGTGLGLASAYGIVAQSGGTITVESESGKGAKFQIFLPAVA